MIEITLSGAPRGKGRPRFRVIKTRRGGSFVSVYTDAATRHYEAALKDVGIKAMDGRPPLDGPLVVVLRVLVPIPASWPRKRREAAIKGDIRPTTKPDLDNYTKCALDGLNSVVWHDDSQVVSTSVSKFYSLTPCLRIGVEKLLPQPIGDFE